MKTVSRFKRFIYKWIWCTQPEDIIRSVREMNDDTVMFWVDRHETEKRYEGEDGAPDRGSPGDVMRRAIIREVKKRKGYKGVIMNRTNPQGIGFATGAWHAILGIQMRKGNACGVSWEPYQEGYKSVTPDAIDETDPETAS